MKQTREIKRELQIIIPPRHTVAHVRTRCSRGIYTPWYPWYLPRSAHLTIRNRSWRDTGVWLILPNLPLCRRWNYRSVYHFSCGWNFASRQWHNPLLHKFMELLSRHNFGLIRTVPITTNHNVPFFFLRQLFVFLLPTLSLGPTLKIASSRTSRVHARRKPVTSSHFPKNLPIPQMVIMLPHPLYLAWWAKWISCLLTYLLEDGRSILTSHVAAPGSEPSRRSVAVSFDQSRIGAQTESPCAVRDQSLDWPVTNPVHPGARLGSRVLTREILTNHVPHAQARQARRIRGRGHPRPTEGAQRTAACVQRKKHASKIPALWCRCARTSSLFDVVAIPLWGIHMQQPRREEGGVGRG